jgi:hypothetical protein
MNIKKKSLKQKDIAKLHEQAVEKVAEALRRQGVIAGHYKLDPQKPDTYSDPLFEEWERTHPLEPVTITPEEWDALVHYRPSKEEKKQGNLIVLIPLLATLMFLRDLSFERHCPTGGAYSFRF